VCENPVSITSAASAGLVCRAAVGEKRDGMSFQGITEGAMEEMCQKRRRDGKSFSCYLRSGDTN